jgi:4a-hydroxytetrahydrobiopterin dehydratase
MSSTKPQTTPRLAPGSDESIIESGLDILLPSTGRWTLTNSGEGIQRLIRFKTFNKAWSFMDRVAQECKIAKHHPEWANTYNTVFMRWTTHSPKGLSEKDVTMALFCDQYAAELGEVIVEGEESGGAREDMVGMVDDLAVKAGDCCVPKKK